MVGFPLSMTPARILSQFGDSLRISSCTKLVLFVQNVAVWTKAVAAGKLQDHVIIVPTSRYEAQHQCTARGFHVCQHGVMYQWLMEQHTMNLNATITNQEAKQVVRTDAANGGGAIGAPPTLPAPIECAGVVVTFLREYRTLLFLSWSATRLCCRFLFFLASFLFRSSFLSCTRVELQ